jgi:hypothetical protein
VRISHRLFGRGYDPDGVGGADMAFSKAVWSAVGGFPDELAASEDHVFSSEVVAGGFRFARAREAAVRCGTTSATRRTQTVARMPWRIRPLTLTSLWSPPGSWRGKRRDVPPLLARRMGRAPRLGLGVASYIALPVRRARAAGYPLRHWWRIPLVVALKDVAQIVGAVVGVLDAIRARPAGASSRSDTRPHEG